MKKIKFIRQRKHSSNCGTVALLNALKIAGYDVTYKKDAVRLNKLCKCYDGILPENFDEAIRKFDGLDIFPKKNSFVAPPIKLIDEHLSLGGFFVIGYIYKYKKQIRRTHFTLCIGKKNKKYILVNNTTDKTISYIWRRTLIKMLRFSDLECGGSDVWFLFKRSN